MWYFKAICIGTVLYCWMLINYKKIINHYIRRECFCFVLLLLNLIICVSWVRWSCNSTLQQQMVPLCNATVSILNLVAVICSLWCKRLLKGKKKNSKAEFPFYLLSSVMQTGKHSPSLHFKVRSILMRMCNGQTCRPQPGLVCTFSS